MQLVGIGAVVWMRADQKLHGQVCPLEAELTVIPASYYTAWIPSGTWFTNPVCVEPQPTFYGCSEPGEKVGKLPLWVHLPVHLHLLNWKMILSNVQFNKQGQSVPGEIGG